MDIQWAMYSCMQCLMYKRWRLKDWKRDYCCDYSMQKTAWGMIDFSKAKKNSAHTLPDDKGYCAKYMNDGFLIKRICCVELFQKGSLHAKPWLLYFSFAKKICKKKVTCLKSKKVFFSCEILRGFFCFYFDFKIGENHRLIYVWMNDGLVKRELDVHM